MSKSNTIINKYEFDTSFKQIKQFQGNFPLSQKNMYSKENENTNEKRYLGKISNSYNYF